MIPAALFRVAILGTGFGGLCMAIQLTKAGVRDFTIFEKSDGVGGTWRDNTYPGAACDVPSHLYSFSFEPKADWSRKFARQPEILSYLRHCVEKYDLERHIRYGTEIATATFDEERAVWVLRSKSGKKFEAEVLVSACGQLNRPAYPSLPGIDRFRGETFHSARWNHAYDFAGKHVLVVGTGASAIQFVPEIAKTAATVTVFQRSSPWILPKPDRAYSSLEQSLFAKVPAIQALHRLKTYCLNESSKVAFRRNSLANTLFARLGKRHIRKYIKDPVLIDAVTPDDPPGCKRVLISNDWYAALSRPSVRVVTDPIVDVERDGIATGERRELHQADVIVYGTGFKATGFLAPMRITGKGGRDLHDAWREGAEAHLGMTVSGFPNLFLLYGPNTNLAHNSIVYMLESQVRYAMSCIDALDTKNLRYMDVKDDRQGDYNEHLQKRLSRSVWSAGCSSWYKTASGKNTNNWPGFTLEYRWRTRRVDLDDFNLAARSDFQSDVIQSRTWLPGPRSVSASQ